MLSGFYARESLTEILIIQKECQVATRLTFRPGDAGAMPRMACYLVTGKGVGRPRQRT
jgi:hypothetical protein